jgi:LysM repeat protein
MFGKILLIAALALIAWAALARASHGAGPEQQYTVRPGDTLWSIAAAHYTGDPRQAVWKLQQENHLAGGTLTPGQVLRLP